MLSWVWWVIIIAVVIAGLLYWSGRRFSPEKIARNAARTMLAAYYAFEKAFPGLKKEELYMKTLMSRPTIRNEETAKEIFEEARETSRETGQPVRLWMIVLWVVMHQYDSFRSHTSNLPGEIPHALEFYDEFLAAVRQIIPEDI